MDCFTYEMQDEAQMKGFEVMCINNKRTLKRGGVYRGPWQSQSLSWFDVRSPAIY